MQVYQIYFNKESKKHLLPGFIPYDNTLKRTKLFENSVILDIWKSGTWRDSDYVGVVSWRFKEKTGLTFEDLRPQDKDVYLLTPSSYMRFKSPYSEKGFGSVKELAKLADKERLFPFDLTDYDAKYHNDSVVAFCNFFLVRPHIFDDYCKNYLQIAVGWLNSKKELRAMKCRHRDRLYPAQTFFLEGLFQCYVHWNKLSFEYIPKHLSKPIEEPNIAELLMK